MCPADHLRLVYSYVTATRNDGGLGIAPLSEEWDRVESIMALHDHLFNDTWIRAWTRRQLGFVQFDKTKEQVRTPLSIAKDKPVDNVTLVWRIRCSVLLLPLIIHEVPRLHLRDWGHLLLLRKTLFASLLYTPRALVDHFRRMVEYQATYSFRPLGNPGLFQGRETKSSIPAYLLVEARPSDDSKPPRHHTLRRSTRCAPHGYLRLRGIRDTIIHRPWS